MPWWLRQIPQSCAAWPARALLVVIRKLTANPRLWERRKTVPRRHGGMVPTRSLCRPSDPSGLESTTEPSGPRRIPDLQISPELLCSSHAACAMCSRASRSAKTGTQMYPFARSG